MRCRLCLVECSIDNSKDLFDHGEESNVTKLITKYIHLQIAEDDAFSTIVCESCLQNLNEFHKFILLVEQRQAELRNELLDVKCVLTDEKENFNSSTNNEGAFLDMDHLVMESEDHVDNSMKEEFGYASDTQISQNENENFEVRHSSDGWSEKEDNDDEIPLQAMLDKPKNSKQSKRLIKQTNKLNKKRGRPRKSNSMEEIEKSNKTKRPNILSKEDREKGEQILKSIRLKCDLCDEPANTLQELRNHFREIHNSTAYIICCGRRFVRRFVLLDHLRYHLNPEHFKCEVCDKVFKSRNCVINHHANMHSDTQNRKHECQICKKRFAHVSNLKSHMITHTSARDYVCEICNKGFKSANLLKNHITYVHENKQQFICEICGQKYKFKAAFKRHVAEHDAEPNQLTEECPICKKWFRPNGVRFHIKRHDLKDIKCESCGKIVKSKMALKSHIKYWHTQKEMLKCNYCDKTFKRSSVLKEHIAMHTGQKDYNCPHCAREFRSKANMYAHIKKIHVEEWMQVQAARIRDPTQLLAIQK